jgi:hypothetical protein
MIDTIRLTCDLPLRKGAHEEFRNNQRSDWTFSSRAIHHSNDDTDQAKLFGKQAHTDLRVGIDKNERLVWVEVSLPRVLGNPNGIQLKTQEDLSAAISILLPKLQIFPRRRIEARDFTIARLDLVLNLRLAPKFLLPIHRHARHKGVRRATREFYNQGPGKRTPCKVPHEESSLNTVVFDGSKLRISLYNKKAEVYGGKRKAASAPDAISTRVEVQLKDKKLMAGLLGFPRRKEMRLSALTFEACYRAFRGVMLDFHDSGRMPLGKPSITRLMALLATHPYPHPRLGGIDPLDWYRHSHSEKSYNRMRVEVSKQVLDYGSLHWANYLPEDRLPDVVDVDAEGNEVIVFSPHAFH